MKLVQYGSGRVPRADIREISCAVSVGGFRGKHGDFDLWVSYDPARGLLTKFSCLLEVDRRR